MTLTRFRMHFQKTGDMRYIGHLDLHRTIERMLRRANLPLDYSRGYNPRVKLNLSTALPLGCTSTCELADFWLLEALEEEQVLQSLRAVIPGGLSIEGIEKIDLRQPSLQSQISSASYRISLPEGLDVPKLRGSVGDLLASNETIRIRRGKRYDLRPLIHSLELLPDEGTTPVLELVLSAGEGKTGRPEEVLLELGLDPAITQIERTALHLMQPTQDIQSE